MLELLLALLAGILTIAAPCILIPLPIILGASLGQRSRTRPLFIALGFTVTFAALGLFLNSIIQRLGLSPIALRNAAAALLVLFGFFMIFPEPFERLASKLNKLIAWAGQRSQSAGPGNLGGLFLGAIIGIVWAPCAGPILGAILTLVSRQSDFIRAAILLSAYAIGASLPMLAIAYGGQALSSKIRSLAKYSFRVQQIFGAIIILLAVAIYFQYDTYLQAQLLLRLPILNPIL